MKLKKLIKKLQKTIMKLKFKKLIKKHLMIKNYKKTIMKLKLKKLKLNYNKTKT